MSEFFEDQPSKKDAEDPNDNLRAAKPSGHQFESITSFVEIIKYE
jgi:hypothetical protein